MGNLTRYNNTIKLLRSNTFLTSKCFLKNHLFPNKLGLNIMGKSIGNITRNFHIMPNSYCSLTSIKLSDSLAQTCSEFNWAGITRGLADSASTLIDGTGAQADSAGAQTVILATSNTLNKCNESQQNFPLPVNGILDT